MTYRQIIDSTINRSDNKSMFVCRVVLLIYIWLLNFLNVCRIVVLLFLRRSVTMFRQHSIFLFRLHWDFFFFRGWSNLCSLKRRNSSEAINILWSSDTYICFDFNIVWKTGNAFSINRFLTRLLSKYSLALLIA